MMIMAFQDVNQRAARMWDTLFGYPSFKTAFRQAINFGNAGGNYLIIRIFYLITLIMSQNIRICHALYGLHYREVLLEVREFLNEHSKEVSKRHFAKQVTLIFQILILDINHAYGFQKEDLKCFREITIEILRHADICPVTQPTDVSLEYMWRNNYR